MKKTADYPCSVLVTGSRGKSSMVRLITAALAGSGLKTRGRITGVLPREITGTEETLILRSGPGNVEEMRWWLSTLPPDTEAVVLENSAVDPELQPLAFRWLNPSCTVLTNVRPDHEEVWGEGEAHAIRALSAGVLGGPVILPRSVAEIPLLRTLLEGQGCTLHPCPDGKTFRETHLALTEGVCRLLGRDGDACLEAARSLPADLADFRLFSVGEGILASAFSANDPESTEELFRATGWAREETTLLYNSRGDRFARLQSFLPWFRAFSWKGVCLTGKRPLFLPAGMRAIPLKDLKAFEEFISSSGQVFGCGNVAGIPLDFLLSRADGRGSE